ncbi:MAG: hypothetical protein NZL93_02370, partial [Chthoniobacterales bacterium]|nr:hypothetical protein [Chthoniobacterales bacterium]
LFLSKGVTAAEEHFRISTELDPDIPEAWNNLGLCLIEQPGKIAEGLQAIQKALDISHDNPNFKAAKFLALTRLYRLEEAYEYIQEVTSGFFWRQQEMSSLCSILNYLPEKSREEIFNSHVRYGKSLFSFGMSTWENEPNPDKKLHIGFVSAYFRRHSVAYFLLPLLQLLDKRQFSVYLYFCGEREDSTSDEFKLCSSKWVNISQTPDEEAAQQIKKDSIDILFDLTGHFANNRLSLFGELPAPIQATFLGYPNTTGLSSIKYRFVDEITDPPGSEKFATEQLVRFSPCAWCYDPLVDAPEPQMPQLNTPLTFGSFNNFLKVNRKVLNVWKQILENFPESRLLLKSINFSDPTVREEVTKKIKNSGIELSRVELREFVDNLPDHLRMYSEVDVALDTFPYNGTTTTCEALWMGVPVVTLVGDRHSSRVGLSLLSAVGHPEWAAQNEDEYIQKAVELAKNRNLRIHLRSNLRKKIAESRLCNKQAYASDFCNAVRKLWVQWCTEQTT